MISLDEYREHNPIQSGEDRSNYDNYTYKEWKNQSLCYIKNMVESDKMDSRLAIISLIEILETEVWS